MTSQRMQIRRGLSSEWTTVNPILYPGELGFETDTGKFKIGSYKDAINPITGLKDLPTNWSDRLYVADIADGSINIIKINATSVTGYIKGNGSASLTPITTIPLSDGGTNASLTATSGGIVYGTGVALSVIAAGTAGQILQSNGASAPSWTQATPTGSITQFAVPTAPTGWLNCDGSTFSNVTYPALATLLGDTYGVHSGANYYLPDMRGRVPVGIGLVTDSNALTQTFTIGTKSGELKHTIAAGELPSHTHTWSGTTSSDGAHSHANPVAVTYGGDAGNYRSLFATNSPFWSMADYNNATNTAGAHTHTVSGTTAGTAATATTPVLQPYLVLNYIIKT